MTTNELKQKLFNVKNSLSNDFIELFEGRSALTLSNLIKNRITNRGLNYKGDQLGQYSTNDMLVNGASNWIKPEYYERFKKNRKKEVDPEKKKWVTVENKGKSVRLAVLKGGYKEFRKLNNLSRTEFVDLSFTDSATNSGMWSKIKTRVFKSDEFVYTISVDGTTEEIKDRIGYLSKKYANGDDNFSIIAASDQEIEIILNDYTDILNQFFINEGIEPPEFTFDD